MKLNPTEILVLRTCNQDMTSHNGFKWKKKGVVTAPDWEPTYKCGNGLHGLPWGQGGDYLSIDGVWLVLKVDTSKDYLTGKDELTDKCKFRTCTVIFSGTREEATQLVYNHAPNGTIVYGLSMTGGNWSTLTGGNRATLTGGNMATLTGGDWSTLTGGDLSTLTGGDRSTLTGGDWSTLTGGNMATLTGRHEATLTGGNWATLTWRIYDGNYYRLTTVYVGENGIEPNTAYSLVDGKVTKV